MRYEKLKFVDSSSCSSMVQDAEFFASCVYNPVSELLTLNDENLEFNISPHFHFKELVKTSVTSVTNNLPISSEQLYNLIFLTYYVLEPIRDVIGAFTPNSVFRSKYVNMSVAGAFNSKHLYGLAVDVPICNLSEDVLSKLDLICINLKLFVIKHPTYYHIDLRNVKLPIYKF